LIEALLAVVILSGSLVIIVQSLASSLRAITYTSDYTLGLILLENKIFDYIQMDSSELDSDNSGAFEEPHNKYRYSLKTDFASCPSKGT